MVIVLVGESASGKSTLETMINERNQSFSKIVSYTTRPIRDGEKDGVDYHFVNNETFDTMKANGLFIENAQYRGWYYGSAISDYVNPNKNYIAVLTPHGCRSLKKWSSKHNDVKVYSIYLCVDRKSRMLQIINRGDNIDEAYRRNISDVGQFDGFADEADYVICNNEYKKSKEQVYDEAKRIISRLCDEKS